jgi:hypothetical protein
MIVSLQISIFSIPDNKTLGVAIFRCLLSPCWLLASDWQFWLEKHGFKSGGFDFDRIKSQKNYKSHHVLSRIGNAVTTEVIEIVASFGNQIVVADELAQRMPVLFALMASDTHPFYHPTNAPDFCCNLPIFLAYIRHLLHVGALLFSTSHATRQVKSLHTKTGVLTNDEEHVKVGLGVVDLNEWYRVWSTRFQFLPELVKLFPESKRNLSLYDLVYILIYGLSPYKPETDHKKFVLTYHNSKKGPNDLLGKRPSKSSLHLIKNKVPAAFFDALHKKVHKNCKLPRNVAEVKQLKKNMKEESWEKGTFLVNGNYNHSPPDDDGGKEYQQYLSGFGPRQYLSRYMHVLPDNISMSSDTAKKRLNEQYSGPVDPNGAYLRQKFDNETPVWKNQDVRTKTTPREAASVSVAGSSAGGGDGDDGTAAVDQAEESGGSQPNNNNAQGNAATASTKDRDGPYVRSVPKANQHHVKKKIPDDVYKAMDIAKQNEIKKALEDDMSEAIKKAPNEEVALRIYLKAGKAMVDNQQLGEGTNDVVFNDDELRELSQMFEQTAHKVAKMLGKNCTSTDTGFKVT